MVYGMSHIPVKWIHLRPKKVGGCSRQHPADIHVVADRRQKPDYAILSTTYETATETSKVCKRLLASHDLRQLFLSRHTGLGARPGAGREKPLPNPGGEVDHLTKGFADYEPAPGCCALGGDDSRDETFGVSATRI